MKKTYITNDCAVAVNSIKVLADNGEKGDSKLALERAKIVGGGTAYYITTNGDPLPVAAIDADGCFLWGWDAFGGSASNNLPWLADESDWLLEARDKRFVEALKNRLKC